MTDQKNQDRKDKGWRHCFSQQLHCGAEASHCGVASLASSDEGKLGRFGRVRGRFDEFHLGGGGPVMAPSPVPQHA